MVFDWRGWALPSEPRWDVTGFGLEDFDRYDLTSLNLCELPEYCIISEISTQNDGRHDNIWGNPAIKRFDTIEHDAPLLAWTIA